MEKSRLLKGACLRATLLSSRLCQSSLEYLLIISLTFAIIVPTTYLFYNYSRESSQELTDAQITKLGRSITDAAESIFYSGRGSKAVLELNIPDNIASASIIDGKELVFNVTTSFGVSEIVFFSSVNITAASSNCIANVCTIPELARSGLKKVKVEAISQGSVKIEVI